MSNYNSTQRIERNWAQTVVKTQAIKDKGLEIRRRTEELSKNRRFASYPSDSNQSADKRWADTVKITQGFKNEEAEIRRLRAELKKDQFALHY